MLTGDHDNRAADWSSADRAGIVRGVVVISAAVLVGAFIAVQGLDSPSSEAVAAGGSTTSASITTTTLAMTSLTPSPVEGSSASGDVGVGAAADGVSGATSTSSSLPDPSSSTVAMAADPSGVTVLVLNGAGTKGAAGRAVAILADIGYDTLAPKNAAVLGPTQVLYADGFEPSASEIAAVFEVDTATVVAPLDPDAAPVDDVQDADVIVVIGEDGLIDV